MYSLYCLLLKVLFYQVILQLQCDHLLNLYTYDFMFTLYEAFFQLQMCHGRTKRIFHKPGFRAVCYIDTMPRLVLIETWIFGIIHCNICILYIWYFFHVSCETFYDIFCLLNHRPLRHAVSMYLKKRH